MTVLTDGRLARLLLSALGLAALLYSWDFTWHYFVSPVWFDMWFWAADYQKWVAGHYTLQDLIKPHAEHRIATTRLLLLIDSIYFQMSGYFVAVCNLLALLLLGVGIGRIAMSGVSRGSVWFVPVVVWAGFVAATCQADNLAMAFQVQFALTCCAALGAAWFFAIACAPELDGRAAAARASCGAVSILVAVFSMGSGILLLPAVAAMLWLRRAPRTVWVTFVLCAAIVLAVEMPGHLAAVGLPGGVPSSPSLLLSRARYCAMFLGSIVNALPAAAPWAGLAGYLVVLVLAALIVWRRLRGGSAVPASDAALLALALFAAMCGPAGSLTPRMTLGANPGLAAKYATMCLLLWASSGALLLRILDRTRPARAWTRGLLVATVGVALFVVNLPQYARSESNLRRDIELSSSLLANDVYADGPALEMLPGIDIVHDTAVFLHTARLNMFAPAQGPPMDLLRKLSAAPLGSLPSCRGWIDWATAIDDGAVMLDGWLSDPGGRHTAPWIVVRDEGGRIVGMARSLEERVDLGPATGFKPPAFGFHGGFHDGADGTRRLRLAGIFPDRKAQLCELSGAAEVSGVLVQPIAQLRDVRDAPFVGAAALGSGFAAGLGAAARRRGTSNPPRWFSVRAARRTTLARWISQWRAASRRMRRWCCRFGRRRMQRKSPWRLSWVMAPGWWRPWCRGGAGAIGRLRYCRLRWRGSMAARCEWRCAM